MATQKTIEKVSRRSPLTFPVVSLGAEYLVMGHLMRRNILAYKAPPHNEGYDIICIHPDPKRVTRQIRVQVKSRYQTDCDRSFPLKGQSLDAFDYVVVVFLNIGNFYSRVATPESAAAPEFYTLPKEFVRSHHYKVSSGFDKVRTGKLDLAKFKDEKGFELIAQDLGVEYPGRPA